MRVCVFVCVFHLRGKEVNLIPEGLFLQNIQIKYTETA